VIFFARDGNMTVSKIAAKFFVGKNPFYLGLFRKDDEAVYSILYRDGRDGPVMAKRFKVGGTVRDKGYQLTKGTPGSAILYFARHENEAESDRQVLTIHLKEQLRLRNVVLQFPFASLAVKNRDASGNIVTKHAVEKILRRMEPLGTKPADPPPAQ
jgi:topoisomerase-4 subunit A